MDRGDDKYIEGAYLGGGRGSAWGRGESVMASVELCDDD